MELLMAYALPPLIGGFIGYVTNALAIKMLFRPLRAYKIGPIPVPFTPGIIPRQRASLARNIGTMVSTQLMAPETVQQRLQEPETAQALSLHLEESLKTYARKPFRELFALNPEGGPLSERPGLRAALDRLVDLGLTVLLPRTPAELLGMKGTEKVFPWDQEEGKQAFLTYLRDRIAALSGEAGNLKQVFGPDSFSHLGAFLEGLYPSVVKGVFHWLETPEVKRQLEAAGLALLEKTLSRLSGFQRFFVSAGQYDRTLADNMGALVDDGLSQLRIFLETPNRRREIILAVVGALERFLEVPSQDSAAPDLSDRLTALADKAWDLFQPMFSRWAGEAVHRPLEEWAKVLSGADTTQFRDNLSRFLLNFLDSSRNSDRDGAAGSWWDLSPGEILPLLEEDYRKVSAYLSENILAWGTEAVPGLLKSFNVQKVVEDRINTLDILEVENLLLLVIRKHLSYINWIGALLGALIGGVQVFL